MGAVVEVLIGPMFEVPFGASRVVEFGLSLSF